METKKHQHIFELTLDGQGFEYLRETAKWAKFISIVGFVFCGLMVLIALFAGTLISTSLADTGAMDGNQTLVAGLFTTIYIILAGLGFFPCLFTFRFAVHMQKALKSNDQDKLLVSLKNLKAHYRFVGIMCIITIAFYALGIVLAVIAGAIGAFQ